MLLPDKIKWAGTAITLIGAVQASLGVYPYSAIFLRSEEHTSELQSH